MNTFTAKRDGICAVSGQPIVAGQTLIGYRNNQVVLAEYVGPTSGALRKAAYLKSQQRMSASDYARIWERPAPAWMSATVEEIAIHIDLVDLYARKHGVQLKWEHIEYGSTREQIEAAAIAKQGYRYTVGDYLPREAATVATVGKLSIRDYFGVFYIAQSDMVVGTYADGYGDLRVTGNNLTRHHIIAIRYPSADAATRAAAEVNQRQPDNFVDWLYTLA